MLIIVIAMISLHVLSAVFWAGTTFSLARTGGAQVTAFRWPQLGAALTAILTGAGLWDLLHADSFDSMEQVLAIGALCALIAAAVQLASGIFARSHRMSTEDSGQPLRDRVAQRAAAGLLAIAVICMAAARYT
jgi:hypothetical protein